MQNKYLCTAIIQFVREADDPAEALTEAEKTVLGDKLGNLLETKHIGVIEIEHKK